MEIVYVKCPNCGHIFDSHEHFYWTADFDGHPTVENFKCPKCGAGTEPSFRCELCPHEHNCKLEEMCPCCDSWDYDSFEVAEGAHDNKEDSQTVNQQTLPAAPETGLAQGHIGNVG